MNAAIFPIQLAAAGVWPGHRLAGRRRPRAPRWKARTTCGCSTPAPVSLPARTRRSRWSSSSGTSARTATPSSRMLESLGQALPADVQFRQVPVGFTARHQLGRSCSTRWRRWASSRRCTAASSPPSTCSASRLNTEPTSPPSSRRTASTWPQVQRRLQVFSVNTKASRAKQLSDAYKIDGVPALGIHGRFFTSGALAGSHERALAGGRLPDPARARSGA
jgi:protein dithiol oxidoreductase (disulfide-forming)